MYTYAGNAGSSADDRVNIGLARQLRRTRECEAAEHGGSEVDEADVRGSSREGADGGMSRPAPPRSSSLASPTAACCHLLQLLHFTVACVVPATTRRVELRLPCSLCRTMPTARITRYYAIPRLALPLAADAFHTDFVTTNTPVIMPLDTATSPADWSLPRLQSLLGSLTMNNVFQSTDGRYTFFDPKRQAGGTRRDGLQRQRMTFDEFVHHAGQAGVREKRKEAESAEERKEATKALHDASPWRYYLYGEPLPAPLQPLLPPPAILTSIPSLSSSLLWVAVDGSISPLHYDLSDGLLCQLHRSKHFLLFPPHHYRHLAPYPTDHAHDRQSQLSFDTRPPVQLQKGEEELQGGLEGWVGEVREGEMIYLPYGWWHQVQSDGECVSVTHRWDEYQQQLQQIRAVSMYHTNSTNATQNLVVRTTV